jgi:hypothetical protein
MKKWLEGFEPIPFIAGIIIGAAIFILVRVMLNG